MRSILLQSFIALFATLLFNLHSNAQLADGDFEFGLGGATTSLNNSCPASGAYGEYCITTISTGFGGQFTPTQVPCNGSLFMCCDARPNTYSLVWQQTGTGLVEGCEYTLSFCLVTISGTGNNNFIDAYVDGNLLLTNLSTTNAWTVHTVNFIATSTTAVVQIFHNATAVGSWFDFGLDNIAISGENCMNNSCYYIPAVGRREYGSETIPSINGEDIMTIGTLNRSDDNQDKYFVEHRLSTPLNMIYNGLYGDDENNKMQEYSTSIMSDGEFYYGLGFIDEGGDYGTALHITKLDQAGNPVWVNGSNTGYKYGTGDGAIDIGYKILDMRNSSAYHGPTLMVVGRTNRRERTDGDLFALVIDKNSGAVVNYRVYRGFGPHQETDDYAYDAIEVAAHGAYYVLAGEQRYTNSINRNAMGMVIDDNLNMLTNFTTMGMEESDEVAYSVTRLGDNLYFAGLFAKHGGNRDGMIIRAPFSTSTLIPVELHRYAGAAITHNGRDEVFNDITVVRDMLVIAGTTNEAVLPNINDGLMMWFDPSLNSYPFSPLKTVYKEISEAFFDVQVMPDNLIFTGVAAPNAGDDDIYIITTGHDGSNDCCVERYEVGHKRMEPPYHPAYEPFQPEINMRDWGIRKEYYDLKQLCGERRSAHVMENPANNEESQSFTVFPNPATDRITLRVPVSSTGIRSIKIFDSTSKLVHSEAPVNSGNNYTLELDNISSGIYLVEVITIEGERLINKVSIEE